MNQNNAEKSPFSSIVHVGMVVRDIDKAIQHLSSLGIGPFEPYHNKLGIVPPVKRKLRGKPVECQLKVMAAQVGPIALELIQPEGECLQSEFLASRGEGLHHLAFFVDDLDQEVSKLAENGLKPVMEGTMAKGNYLAYFEPEESGGLIIELLQRPKGI